MPKAAVLPANSSLRELHDPQFEKRVNRIVESVDNTLGQAVGGTSVKGIDGGKNYGEIADELQQVLRENP